MLVGARGGRVRGRGPCACPRDPSLTGRRDHPTEDKPYAGQARGTLPLTRPPLAPTSPSLPLLSSAVDIIHEGQALALSHTIPLPKIALPTKNLNVLYRIWATLTMRLEVIIFKVWTYIATLPSSTSIVLKDGSFDMFRNALCIWILLLDKMPFPYTNSRLFYPKNVASHNPLSLASRLANRLISNHDVTSPLYA